ncbi:porin family protein [Flavobacterium agrisoli]
MNLGVAVAQSTTSSSEPEFGVKGGVNLSNLYQSDADDENVLVGFNAGLYAKLPISDNIAFQPELLYTTKGSEVEYNNAIASGKAKIRLDYIELPLLFKFNITENFNIQAGGYASYLVNSKVKNDVDGGTSFDFEDNIDTDDLERFDAGLAAGIGVDFNPISVGLRYNYGLTTIGKERTILGQTYTFPDAKNSSLNLYVSYKL